MKKFLLPMLISSLGFMLCSGCNGPEKEARKELAAATQLIHAARDTEKTSYVEAFNLYQQALSKAAAITVNYPTTTLAEKLNQGRVKIGPYSLAELTETVVPLAKAKAEAEQNPLACALLVAKTLESVSAKAKMLADIANKYTSTGQHDLTLQIVKTAGNATYEMLSRMIGEYTEGGQYDQAFSVATAVEDP